jgi:hypothetical protein
MYYRKMGFPASTSQRKKRILTMPNPTSQEDEFVVVSDGESEPETKIVFDTIGDQFTGEWLGFRHMDNDSGGYQQARFMLDNEVYFTNANYSLRNGLKDVRIGAKVRVTFTSETDTGQRNPMRNFTIEVAKQKAVSNVRKAAKPSS